MHGVDLAPETSEDRGSLTVQVDSAGRTPRLLVSGDLDIATAPLLAGMVQHLQGHGVAVVDVDLQDGTFADSSGLAPVLDDGVVLRSAPAQVWRLLDVLRRLDVPPRPLLTRPSADAGEAGGRTDRVCGRGAGAS